METLRWTLLGLGLLVLLAVFLHSRGVFTGFIARLASKPKPSNESGPAARREPVFGDVDINDTNTPPGDATLEVAPETSSNASPDKVIAIRLVPDGETEFPAEALIMALRENGLRHGKHGVFHRLDKGEEGEGRFCVASLVEPGSFELSNLHDATYPGVSFFMLLPIKEDSVTVFDDMLNLAHVLATQLDGVLLDEAGSRLSIQRERYLREEVIEFERIQRNSAFDSGEVD